MLRRRMARQISTAGIKIARPIRVANNGEGEVSSFEGCSFGLGSSSVRGVMASGAMVGSADCFREASMARMPRDIGREEVGVRMMVRMRMRMKGLGENILEDGMVGGRVREGNGIGIILIYISLVNGFLFLGLMSALPQFWFFV